MCTLACLFVCLFVRVSLCVVGEHGCLVFREFACVFESLLICLLVCLSSCVFFVFLCARVFVCLIV